MFKKLYLRSLLFSLLMGLGVALVAQAETSGISKQDLLQVIMFTLIVMAMVALLLTYTIFMLLRQKAAETATEAKAETPAVERAWSWQWVRQKLTDAVPVAKEADIDLGHEYDGIRELDNNLPPWWKYGFYFTIAWAAVYIAVFHVWGDWSSTQQYEDEMATAEAEVAEYLKTAANLVDESNVTLLTEADALSNGKKIYDTNCATCHGMLGEGGIGPAFADQYWIHGGSIADVFKTVKYGVPEKGMISWQQQLPPREIQEVSSYLLQFEGTTPPNLKDPQGELYEREETPSQEDTEEVEVAEVAQADFELPNQ